jgi:uncharacterized caspase-like protein
LLATVTLAAATCRAPSLYDRGGRLPVEPGRYGVWHDGKPAELGIRVVAGPSPGAGEFVKADARVSATRAALVVASNDYTDPGLKRLSTPANDAQELATVLQDPKIGDFQVRTLLNKPAHEVNLAIEEFFADRQREDLLLVYFSCRGLKDEYGELYFAMANTMLRRLGSTAVPADFVNRCMDRSGSRRVVLLLDCLYGGVFERGIGAR